MGVSASKIAHQAEALKDGVMKASAGSPASLATGRRQ